MRLCCVQERIECDLGPKGVGGGWGGGTMGHSTNRRQFLLCVCPVIDHEFRHTIVKVAVEPRGNSRVDPQTTLTML